MMQALPAPRSQDTVEAACRSIARTADRIDQHAKHVAEVAARSRATADSLQALREKLIARHG